VLLPTNSCRTISMFPNSFIFFRFCEGCSDFFTTSTLSYWFSRLHTESFLRVFLSFSVDLLLLGSYSFKFHTFILFHFFQFIFNEVCVILLFGTDTDKYFIYVDLPLAVSNYPPRTHCLHLLCLNFYFTLFLLQSLPHPSVSSYTKIRP
jgi:hypothetical protein